MPIYNGTTNAYGILVFENMPPDNYAWSCGGQTGTVAIDPSQNPLTITEKEVFWASFLMLASDAPDGEKCKYILQTLARILGYSNPPPSCEGMSDAETAREYANWISGLDLHVDNNFIGTLTYTAAKIVIQVGKGTFNIISKYETWQQKNLPNKLNNLILIVRLLKLFRASKTENSLSH